MSDCSVCVSYESIFPESLFLLSSRHFTGLILGTKANQENISKSIFPAVALISTSGSALLERNNRFADKAQQLFSEKFGLKGWKVIVYLLLYFAEIFVKSINFLKWWLITLLSLVTQM